MHSTPSPEKPNRHLSNTENIEPAIERGKQLLVSQQHHFINRLTDIKSLRSFSAELEKRNILHALSEYPGIAPEIARVVSRRALIYGSINPTRSREDWETLQEIPDSREVDKTVATEIGEYVQWLGSQDLLNDPGVVNYLRWTTEAVDACLTARSGAVYGLTEYLPAIKSLLDASVDHSTLSLGIPANSAVLFSARRVTEMLHVAYPEDFSIDWLVERCFSEQADDKASFTGAELALKYSPELISVQKLEKLKAGIRNRIEGFNLARLSFEGSGFAKNLENYLSVAQLLNVPQQDIEDFAHELEALTESEHLHQIIWKVLTDTDIWIDDRNSAQPEGVTRIVVTHAPPRQIPETSFAPFGPSDREEALENLNQNYDEVIDMLIHRQLERDRSKSVIITALERCGDESLRALAEPERGEAVAMRWGELLANETSLSCSAELGVLYSRLPFLQKEYPAEITEIRTGLVSALKHGMSQAGSSSASIARMVDVPVLTVPEKVELLAHALELVEAKRIPVDIFGEVDENGIQELKSEIVLQLARCVAAELPAPLDLDKFLATRAREDQELIEKLPEYMRRRSS